ncbi:MAG: 2-hydroxyacyl-CoA dehydratase [Firmicutes bacterium]|nr:2-hydroxyacyl-CoA dehydratase [Clostridiales bacterium]MBQ9931482.1 2-hydroxyacyl-CoA dehydratase [Bacillota bacterium]
MSIIAKYAKLIKKIAVAHPAAAFQLLRLGLLYERTRVKRLPPEKIPDAYKYLNVMALDSVRGAMRHPEKAVCVNLFAPVEILQCFGLTPLSVECFSAFMSAFLIEDYFIGYAEKTGMSDTLCSYHKNFAGILESGVFPKPKMALTTTIACDCNVNTFRYLEKKLGVPSYVIDVPYEDTPENRGYLVEQLKELIAYLEKETGKTFREEDLKGYLERENQSLAYQKEYMELQARKYYPSSMTLQLFKLFASHLLPGAPEVLEYYRLLAEDIKKYPDRDMTKIFWVHVLPFYQKSLKKWFDFNPDYQIVGMDFDLDFSDFLDVENPLDALAGKMIRSIYNGPFENKIERIKEALDWLDPDAVIHFCHWGCKQSAGGVMELKKALQEMDMPMLILDGDGLDKRMTPDGQIKTRTEAFLELLQSRRGGDR